jgi:MoaA/NifB/PqqE/SkfB family radical SAM enzyme
MKAVDLFEMPAIVTNATYGIPSLPGGLVTVSLDGPEHLNDPIRGEGVFQTVKQAIHDRDRSDGTTVILQMVLTAKNEEGLEEFVDQIRDWPIDGVAFTFYVPQNDDKTGLAWDDLKDRDAVIDRLIALKKDYPDLIKSHVGALELMYADQCLDHTGEKGENCLMLATLPLYMGDGGNFERTFCCYGNDVDCSRCGAYSVFNTAWHRRTKGEDDYFHRTRHQPRLGLSDNHH